VSKYLIDEYPLIILPSLAEEIGLNEAIILQQVHYWMRHSKNVRDGRKWVYKTYDDWQDEFPWWSVSTIRRTIGSLEKSHLLLSTSKYNKMKIDKTKWYSPDYDEIAKLGASTVQNEQMESPKRVQASDQDEQSNNQRTPETTSETTNTNAPHGEYWEACLFYLFGIVWENGSTQVTKEQRGVANVYAKWFKENFPKPPSEIIAFAKDWRANHPPEIQIPQERKLDGSIVSNWAKWQAPRPAQSEDIGPEITMIGGGK
jgi:hypothetical protein